MSSRLLVAGATGVVGRAVVREAAARGYRLRTLSRDPDRAAALREAGHEVVVADATDPAALAGVCDGVDAVISALGASVSTGAPERRSYFEVDRRGNLNLIEQARASGIGRFVYVGVHRADGYDHTAYVRAHEEVADALRHSGLRAGVLRPTGIFPAFDELLPAARRGFGVVIGGGRARSNPIHQADVAAAALDLLESSEPERAVGGPAVLTRRQIVELACRSFGKQPRILSVPPRVTRPLARLAGRRSARLGELVEFLAAVSVTDCVAPAVGTRRLEDYFLERASGSSPLDRDVESPAGLAR